MSLGGLLASWNPLVHFRYWNDSRVIDPIARALAKTWEYLHRPQQAHHRREQARRRQMTPFARNPAISSGPRPASRP